MRRVISSDDHKLHLVTSAIYIGWIDPKVIEIVSIVIKECGWFAAPDWEYKK
jgi:hypothetical protein